MLWIRNKPKLMHTLQNDENDDCRTTHQLGEVSRRTECQCKFSVYFRDRGDSLTKAVMVNTQQPTEKGREQGRETWNIELDTEERIAGGWDALKLSMIMKDSFELQC